MTTSSDDDLIAAMTDALTVDSASSAVAAAAGGNRGGGGKGRKNNSSKGKKAKSATVNESSSTAAVSSATSEHRRASETSLLTSATSNWFTSAGSSLLAGAAVSGGGKKQQSAVSKKVVGGGQGLFPPSVQSNVEEKKKEEKKSNESVANVENVPSAKQILEQTQTNQDDGNDETSPNNTALDNSFATAHTSSPSPRRSRGRSQSRKSNLERQRKGMPRRRSGSPVETFCARDLPTALEAMEAEAKAAQARREEEELTKVPIKEIDPARIKIGKKMAVSVAATSASAAPSVVSTNCADSGSTDASPMTRADNNACKHDEHSAGDTYEASLKTCEDGAVSGDVGGGVGRKSQRNKSLTDSASTVAMSNVQELAGFLAEAEEAYDAEQEERKLEAERQAEQQAEAPADMDTEANALKDIDDDEKSLELAEIVAGSPESDRSTPKRRGSKSDLAKASPRSYPSVTRHKYNNRNQDSSGSLGANNSQQTFSSLKKGHSSSSSNKSSSLLRRQTSITSNHSSNKSVQFKDISDVPSIKSLHKSKSKSKSKSKPATLSRASSFEATAEMYREKYARCKNRSLWANLDRSIDTNVVADSSLKERSIDQQEKANRLLRRRVRMCFSAMTVIFCGSLDDEPDELETDTSNDLNDSLTSLTADDASIRSGMSGLTQQTTRSTVSSISKKKRRQRHRRRPSGSSQSTVDTKTDSKIPTKRRPSIPISVARLLFSVLIRRRGGLDLDEDFTQAAEADNASAISSERRAQQAEARIDAIVDDVLEALTSTLALVDSISSYDADDPIGRSEASDGRKKGGSFAAVCAGIASRASSLAREDTTCLFINHDIHMLYGQATASYRPEVFFADTAAFNRFLYKNHTTGNNEWDPELELNYEMADACLACIRRKHSADPIGGPPGDLEYVYSLEAVPIHLLRCGRYHDLGVLLSKESYVRRKLRKLGSIDGVKAHIADVEEMNETMANAGDTRIDMSSIFVASFTAMYEVLKTATDQAAMKASKAKSQKYEDRFLSLKIQSAESFHAMGVSLQEHGFEEDAVDAYSHAMETFNNVEVLVMKRGIDRDGRLLRRSSSDESIYLPPIDHIQFIMAETLVGMARVYDEAGNLDAAVESYEKALSLYSKQRSLRHRSGVASTLTTMGIINFRRKEWDVAMASFEEALVILQSLEVDGNKGEQIGDIYQWQGNIKRETGDYQSALALFTEAFYTTTLKYGKMHPRVGRIHQSMAIIHDDLGDFQKSLEHYRMALKIRKRAVSKATKSDDIKAFEVATVEELAVAETLMCMGNVYRVMDQFSKAYDCYLENSLIMRLDVTALLGSAFLSTNGILGLLIGDDGSAGAVNILYNRLMMTLDMARRVELQGKESLIVGDESDNSSFTDNDSKFHLSEQVAECLYDVGIISASRYLKQLDEDNSIRTDQIVKIREEALSCFEEVISIRQERIAALGKMCGHGANDRGQEDERMIVAYCLYEVGHMLSCTFFSLQQRDPTDPIDGDLVSRDISAALAAFTDAKKMFQEMNLPSFGEDDAQEHASDPSLTRAKCVPEILEDMTQTMAILYRETGQMNKALEMYQEQLHFVANGSPDSDDARDDASYFSVESSKLSREARVAQAIEDIGDLLRDQGDTDRALEHYTEALELRSSFDEAGLSVAKTLRLIGRLHLQRKEWDQAVTRFQEELKILTDLLDENSSSIAYCFHSIGKAYEGKEDFESALDFFQRARKTIEDTPSAESDIQYTHVMFDLGNTLLQRAKATNLETSEHELALKCLKTAFDGYKAFYGETCVEAANSLFLQGELFYSQEEYETGIRCFEEALRIYRISLGEGHIKVARTLNLIGLSHLESGSDDVYAMECFDACLAILQSKGHEGSEDHACVLFYKAAAHEKNGQLDLAIVCYEGSVGYYSKLLGSDAMKIAVVLEKLGTCLLNDHEPKKAKTTLEEALRIRKKHHSDSDVETAEIYYGLGIAYCEEKEFNKSLDAYEKCFLLRQELFGESHVEVAQVLNNVGSVFARAGEYERAWSPWNDALAMYRDCGLKENSERIVTTLSNIALSRNLISVHKEGDSIIRTFLIY